MSFKKLEILDIKDNSYSFEFKEGFNILGLNKKYYGLIDSSFDSFFQIDKIESIENVRIDNKEDLGVRIDSQLYNDKVLVDYIPRSITTDLLEEELESYLMEFLNLKNTNIILRQDLIRLREHIYNIKDLTPYRNCNFNDYKAGINNVSSIKFSKKAIEELDQLKKELDEKLLSMERIDLSKEDSNRMEEVKSDYKVYEGLEKEKNIILLNMDPKLDLEPHKIEFNRIRRKKNIRERLSYSFLAIAIVLLYFERGLKSVPFFILGIVLFVAKLKINKKVKRLGYSLYKNNKKERDIENLLKDIDLEQKKLLNKYKLDTRLDFKKFVDKIDSRLESIKEKNSSYDNLSDEIAMIKDRILREESNIKQNKENLREVLNRNRVDDLSGLAYNIDLKSKRDSLREKYKSEKKELILKLEEEDLRSFQEEFLKLNINKTIKSYTSNYYSSAFLDDDLSIKFKSPNDEVVTRINANRVEELYLLFRFNLEDFSLGGDFPLVLNNCFNYFKEREKENIYNYINKISKERQVILITYEKLDVDILDKFKIDYNLVKLL